MNLQNLLKMRPLIMGIVNVTPDSFSDGGRFYAPDAAIAHGEQLLAEGADILDIGGESTRPGAVPVSVEEEIARIEPVIKGLAGKGQLISIDTRNAATMEAALNAGASMINDVSGLTHDERSVDVSRAAKCPVVFMHAQGVPQTMQKNPSYNNVINDISQWFEDRISFCETHRIEGQNVVLDPGVGFGKTLEHNRLILSYLRDFLRFGRPIMLGASRKRFIADLSTGEDKNNRLGGSIAAALWGISQGVNIVRVHDVSQTRQAFDVYQAITPPSAQTK